MGEIMKKYIIIVILTVIFIFLLLYFYDDSKDVLNKKYKDQDVYMEYPYFNNTVIDKYISDYLNNVIINRDDYKLFIDYDYYEKDDIVDLSLYIYKTNGILESNSMKKMQIDLNNNYIVSEKNIIDTSDIKDYDLYKQEFVDKDKKMVALTFDDGPSNNTSKILDILEGYGVKATFFLLGVNIEGNEKVVKRMDDLDMEIGNHLYSHKLVTKLEDKEIKEEISKVDKKVFEIVGKKPTLVRTSYGTFNKRLSNVINRPVIRWNIDTMDWRYHNSKRISNSITKKVHDGDIILMHDIYSATVNSLKITIPKLLDEGYQLVTVSELFYYKNIELENNKAYRYAR